MCLRWTIVESTIFRSMFGKIVTPANAPRNSLIGALATRAVGPSLLIAVLQLAAPTSSLASTDFDRLMLSINWNLCEWSLGRQISDEERLTYLYPGVDASQRPPLPDLANQPMYVFVDRRYARSYGVLSILEGIPLDRGGYDVQFIEDRIVVNGIGVESEEFEVYVHDTCKDIDRSIVESTSEQEAQ